LLLSALEVSVSAFFCGRGGSAGRNEGDVFVDTVGDTFADEDSERRRSVPDVNASAITFDTEDDAVDVGDRPPELRRGVIGFSKSICFRLGDELDDPGGLSESARASRFRCACSMFDVVGTEVDVPPLPPEPRELVLVMDDATICGLPPDRPFVGIGMAADFADRPEVLFLRSTDGIAAFALGLDRTGLVDGTGLPRDVRLSSAVLTSDGMGTWCTTILIRCCAGTRETYPPTLTDRQSAGCMRRCSLAVGARQQPGQPGL
jgi:hypothetical protein